MAQCGNGYLWVGTQFALDRFDGYRFTSIRHDPGDPASLPAGFVVDILPAAGGDLWIGTRRGLARLDPVSGHIRRYTLDQPFRLRSSVAMREDSQGAIHVLTTLGPAVWRATDDRLMLVETEGEADFSGGGAIHIDRNDRVWLSNDEGLWLLDRAARIYRAVVTRGGDSRLRRPASTSLASAPDNTIVWATSSGAYQLETDTGRLVRRLLPSEHGYRHDRVDSIAVDSHGGLWLLLPDAIVRVETRRDSGWRVMTELSVPAERRGSARRLELAEEPSGMVWVAGQFGLARYDPNLGRFRMFRHEPDNPYSIAPAMGLVGYRLLIDEFGAVWAGSNLGGLSRYVPQHQRFLHARSREPALDGASNNIVRAIVEQRHGGVDHVWAGTQGGGLQWWRHRDDGVLEHVMSYRHEAEKGFRLPTNDVTAVAADPESGRVWVAGRFWLAEIAHPGGPVRLVDNADDVEQLVQFTALEFRQAIRELIITGWEGLISVPVASTGPQWADRRLYNDLAMPHPDSPESTCGIHHSRMLAENRIYLASRCGITRLDPASRETVHIQPAGAGRAMAGNNVFDFAEHPSGTFWLGTRGGGLARMREASEDATDPQFEFEWFDRNDGLIDDTVYAILSGPDAAIWLSSNRGLSRFEPETGQARHYGRHDGIEFYEFNHTVAHAGASGRYYFGGVDGFNVFRPDEIEDHPIAPRTHLQRLTVNDHPIEISANEPVRLDHAQNYLVVDYVGIHLAAPERVRYAYRLEGLEADWIEAGDGRQVRYPGLPPGHYRFWLRAANGDGIWSADHLLFEAVIAHPPWRSPWAWMVYALVGVLLLAMAWAMQYRRRRQLEALVDRRTRQLAAKRDLVARQAARLERVLEARTTLFANVSHEFRTPLTLIQASLDQLEQGGGDRAAIELGRRYLNRLLRLVEQLLELSRLRLGRIPRATRAWPLHLLIEQTVAAFRPLAEQRGIRLEMDVAPGWVTRCPQDLVEKMLLNLLGNAIKFCRRNDRIRVDLDGGRADDEQRARIVVSDTGPGIDPAEQSSIFERFYRAPGPGSDSSAGAGIGLALVYEAARVSGGTVNLVSEPGKGSTFIVELPAWRDENAAAGVERLTDSEPHRLALAETERSDDAPFKPEPAHGSVGSLGTVLVVEDNADLRAYLVAVLSGRWQVIEATNGYEGLNLAQRRQPDLIVSDIMMPKLDGLEMLRSLRGDIETSHIPVLLLTARQDAETRLFGLALSADDYLTKPFDPAELGLRLERMLDIRERQRKAERRRLLESAGAPGRDAQSAGEDEAQNDLSTADRALLERLDSWLDRHHEQSGLDSEAMAGALNLQPRTLQRKLKNLTGLTPAGYLRDYRLGRARQLLATTNRSVTDIAISSGFSSPQYFARVFRQVEGQSPGQWREQHRRSK